VHLGPMGIAAYEQFLPSGGWHRKLREWIREYVGEEYGVRATLSVHAHEVPAPRLGSGARLGWTTWLGQWRSADSARGASLELTQHAG
jgi:type VI secretion system protein ImpH